MNWLSRKIVNSILRKPCPAATPTSGDAGKKVNCYSLSLYEGENPKLLIRSLTERGFLGSYWNGNGFDAEATIPFEYSVGLDLSIEHFHGLIRHKYKGLVAFVLREWTWMYKIRSFYILAKQHVPQFFFNKKNLQLPQRMKLLEIIIENQASEPHKAFDSMAMMTYLYSTRWYLHPNKTALRQKMNLYLASFCASGELKPDPLSTSPIASPSSKYQITGQAIATLEQYQIETARAKDAKANRWWMLILTAVLAFFAAFQSGLLKSPVWVDIGLLWDQIKSNM